MVLLSAILVKPSSTRFQAPPAPQPMPRGHVRSVARVTSGPESLDDDVLTAFVHGNLGPSLARSPRMDPLDGDGDDELECSGRVRSPSDLKPLPLSAAFEGDPLAC